MHVYAISTQSQYLYYHFDADRQCRGGSEYLQQGSCLEGYSGTIRTIIPVGSGCTSHVIGDISYIVSGGSLTCLAFEDFNVPTC